jgi:hypothetical protein
MDGENCSLNFSCHQKRINRITKSLRTMLLNISSNQTFIDQINAKSKKKDKLKVKDIPQTNAVDKKIIN